MTKIFAEKDTSVIVPKKRTVLSTKGHFCHTEISFHPKTLLQHGKDSSVTVKIMEWQFCHNQSTLEYQWCRSSSILTLQNRDIQQREHEIFHTTRFSVLDGSLSNPVNPDLGLLVARLQAYVESAKFCFVLTFWCSDPSVQKYPTWKRSK